MSTQKGLPMPLSEQEQRLLEEMERSLYQNDADFVATARTARGRANYRFVAIGVLVAVLGVATLVAGVIIQQPLVGVLGFAVMFVGVLLAVAPPRKSGAPTGPAAPRSGAGAQGASFMDSLGDRWDRRQDGRG